MIGKSTVDKLVGEGRILPEQGFALIEASRRREAGMDPYEGTWAEGHPADAWEHLDYCGRVWFVNAYTATREFGGPEEGGWWYTHLTPLRIAAGPFRDVNDAEEVRDHLQAFADVEERVGNMYSVVGGSQVEMTVESMLPANRQGMVYC